MGKHEAPSSGRSSAPRHAAPTEEKSLFGLPLPDIKLPKLPEISLPKLKNISLPGLKKPEEAGEPEQAPQKTEAPAAVDPSPTRIYKLGDENVEQAISEILAGGEPAADETPAEGTPAEESGSAAENGTGEAEDQELPDEGKSFALPKPDWQAVGAFFEKLSRFGLPEGASAQTHRRSYAFDRRQVVLTAGAALLFFLFWLLPTRGPLRFVLYLIPFLVLALYPALDAVGEVIDRVIPGRNLVMLVASLGLLCLGEPTAAVFVLLIHRVFLLLEAWLYEKRESELEKLDALIPDKAVTETEEGLVKKDPKELAPGDILFVPAGELVALDGVVIEGISSLDASALCGEGEVLDVGVNGRVYAGCRNTTNPLRIRVTESFDDSTVQRCVARARQAAASEPSRGSLLQKILSYVPLGLAVLGVLMGLIVSIATGNWGEWLRRGLLLIALAGCGDALLSARMAYFTGITEAFRTGLSFLNADTIDRFAGSDMMIFSKTGTVTEGKYSVVAVYPVNYEQKDLLTIAALAECQSTHPIAQALREACGIEMHHRSDITLLDETPGRGIHALFGGRNVYVGNSSLLLEHNITFDVPSHKGTVIHVAVDNQYAGCIVLNDKIRDGAFDAIEELRLRGIRATVMLTGDVRSMARPIASSLNFDMVKCELSNESKLEALNYLRESKGTNAAISYVSSKDEDLELLQAADVGVGFAALSERGLIGGASVLVMSKKVFQIPQALFRAKRISLAALLSALIMLAAELLLIVLGVCGVVHTWLALLILLLVRVGTLAYAIYFK